MKKERIIKMLSDYSITPTEKIVEDFLEYYDLLVETNKVMNLTAITEFEDVVQKHFSDSLSIFLTSKDLKEKYINKQSCNIIDIGTGAGFPGIPIKIVYPETEIVLMDSLGKRITFLNNVIDNLDMKNIEAVNMRAEEAGTHEKYREKFDFCFCRAVARMNIISEYALPLVKTEGYFVPYKALEIDEEIKEADNAIKKLGGKIEEVNKLVLPGTDIGRTHVLVKKIKHTDKIYPRSNSKIKKNPL